jgi:pimeloyl-ACP methyl ester carboxylesterase
MTIGLASTKSRRASLKSLAGLAISSLTSASAANDSVAYGKDTLPSGIRSRFADGINGLRIHFLESGFERPNRPCILLLHGFPELAYCWRKVMTPLAKRGFHVVAPDLRGYGRTTGWENQYDTNLSLFGVPNMVRDVVDLLSFLGYRSAHLIGRDAGSPLAGWCALIRPEMFPTVTLMTSPFTGAPSTQSATNIAEELAALPRPRKYYQPYYATREAAPNLRNCPQGLHAFFRAYWHYKSADWAQNKPFPLQPSATEMARMPTYYVMDLNKGMCETAIESMPTPKEIAACKWFTNAEVDVYASEYSRTGFQGALNFYRRSSDKTLNAQLQAYSGKRIEVPACFIAGKSDWGPFQNSGALDKMRNQVCPKLEGPHFIDGAGHWVQEEQPAQVIRIVQEFLRKHPL